MYGTKAFLYLLGYETFIPLSTQIRLAGGGGVNLVYSCIGYGVTSFWLAFVFANDGSFKRKLFWMTGGTLLLFFINTIRIGLTLLGNSQKWHFPFGWDNHTWFNIVAYLAIFVMIYYFDRTQKLNTLKQQTKE